MTPAQVWQALSVCGACGEPAALLADPIRFVAPQPLGKWDGNGKPPAWDGTRVLWAALYFRDPFHTPALPFVNYCSARCSLGDYEAGGER